MKIKEEIYKYAPISSEKITSESNETTETASENNKQEETAKNPDKYTDKNTSQSKPNTSIENTTSSKNEENKETSSENLPIVPVDENDEITDSSAEASGYYLGGDILYYAEYDQWCSVFRYNLSTGKKTQIKAVGTTQFYEPKLQIGKKKIIIHR